MRKKSTGESFRRECFLLVWQEKRLVNDQILPEAMWTGTGCQEGARVQTYLLVVAADNKESVGCTDNGILSQFHPQWEVDR